MIHDENDDDIVFSDNDDDVSSFKYIYNYDKPK